MPSTKNAADLSFCLTFIRLVETFDCFYRFMDIYAADLLAANTVLVSHMFLPSRNPRCFSNFAFLNK